MARYKPCPTVGCGPAVSRPAVGTGSRKMLDLGPGGGYVPPSTDAPAADAGWPTNPAADGRAAAGSPEADRTAPRRPGRRERFPVGPEARAFRRRFFPAASAPDWNDWRWQAR